jgi:Leucine-rich repeat (LRR) protein
MLPQKLGHQIFPNFSLKSSYGNPKKIYIRETHTKPLHAMTEYAKNVIEQNKRTQNPTLDLGNCGLTELPDLSGMDWVDTLILSTLWSEYDDTKQEWIIYESQHNISNNRFENTQGSRIELPMLKKLIASGTEIQHCIFLENLTNLTSLYLSTNQISDCRFLEKLTNLTSLDLSYNQISDCRFLEKLTNLTSLYLSTNQISDYRFLEKLTNLTSLHLSGNEISDYRFLEKLTNLTSIDLSYNQISDGRFLENLTNLSTLNLSSNRISDGRFLKNLTSLTSLGLSHNEINDGRSLENLTNLKALNLSNNRISDGRFLENLTNLTSLGLSHNKLNDCRFLENLTNLSTLDLSINRISNGRFLENLTSLTSLDLSHNDLSDCRFLEKLTNLTSIDLSYNQISDGRFLEKMTNLNTLILGGNQISDYRFLEKMTNLNTLSLGSNQLSDCSFLEKLTNLNTLNLSDNRISDCKFLKNLTNLSKLVLSDNQISDLTPLRYLIEKRGLLIGDEVSPFSGNNTIDIANNPLTTPPIEIVKQGNAAIREYFQQKDKAGSRPLLEAKMVLLGDGRAGKTSLACRLLGRELPRQEDRTQGVDISIGEYRFQLAGGEFVLHIWDFAGQDKYKPLHQFFYTEGAVYVLVADSGNAQTDFADWFETAQMFGGGEGPLLVALNEFREGMGGGAFDEQKWRVQFPKLIKEVGLVNLLTQKGLPQLEHNIRHFASQLPHARTEYPNNWANIRAELERRRDENYIPLAEYLKIAREHGIPERESALILSGVLHRIGVCLHYQQSSLLRQYVILKNEWATAAVYQVLEDPTVAEQKKGFFNESDLQRIWSDDRYQDMQPQLLELMQEFGLAYPLPNQKDFITPPLLPNTPPSDWAFPEADAIEIRVEYAFMPKALITQFIVARHTDIDRGRTLVWREGVVLRWSDNTLAQVSKFKSEGRDALRIRVAGSDRRGLLSSVVKTLRDLHGEYQGIQVYERMPCPCEGCRSGRNRQHYFEYHKLVHRLEKGRRDVECDESLDKVDLLKLLGDVFLFAELKVGKVPIFGPEMPKRNIPRAFFSYSKHDVAYLEAFKNQLSALQREGKIRFWDDRYIQPGDAWDEKIKDALHTSDIIFLLMSADFIATDYIWETEIPRALERHAAREARVIPIKIRACDWTVLSSVKDLQALPRKDQLIGPDPKNDAVWTEVVREIREMLEG